MPTVTSENRQEFIDKELAKKEPRMSDPSMYRTYSKSSEELSKNARDAMSHWEAMGAHKHAAMFAKPHPIHKEHEEKAKHHSAEHRKLKRVELERYLAEREENARKANIRSNKAKGIIASSAEEKRTGKYDTY
jgi:hypothetical protein